MTGRMPQDGINQAELPKAVAHIWGWFMRMNACRQGGMGGALPISHMEMLAFFQLEGHRPDGWELDAIRLLDGIALDSQRDA